VVLPTGNIKDSYFERNRAVMVDHRHDLTALVGKARVPFGSITDEASGRQRGWKVRVTMVETPLANDILSIAREHGIGCSIGFMALNVRSPTQEEKSLYGSHVASVIDRWNWTELSVTAMPANASCQSVSEGETKSMCDIDEMCSKGLIRLETAHMLGLPKTVKIRGKTIFVL